LFVACEIVPPFTELISEFDLTCHLVHIMPSMACLVNYRKLRGIAAIGLFKLCRAFACQAGLHQIVASSYK
jgi:hypothetical protein